MNSAYYIGIDVQVRRGCSFCVLDGDGASVETGWIPAVPVGEAPSRLAALVRDHAGKEGEVAAVGIDAPRAPLAAPREWNWSSARNAWRPRAASERGYGRHCEVAIKALGIANPQWTRPLAESPDWMKLGYALFRAMPRGVAVHEVFPSASYRLLENDRDLRVTIDFSGFARGPKDMLDACIAAATVREFDLGRGCEIGGGDGLGAIVLPRPVEAGGRKAVLAWPERAEGRSR